MPEHEEEFEQLINDFGDIIRVRFVRDGKRIIRFAVQYEAMIEGEERPIARYDTAHGQPHRDLLAWDGTTTWKDAMAYRDTYGESMADAIDDLKANWERYRSDFHRRRP